MAHHYSPFQHCFISNCVRMYAATSSNDCLRSAVSRGRVPDSIPDSTFGTDAQIPDEVR